MELRIDLHEIISNIRNLILIRNKNNNVEILN